MNTGSNQGCWQRRENKAPSVCGKFVMAAVKGKVEGDRPVSDWLSMEDVPADKHQTSEGLLHAHLVGLTLTACTQQEVLHSS